mgnify:CR=1 FL=1
MSNIYQDGTYIQNNPSLHEEDSEYKLGYICTLLEELCFEGESVRVLDVGGGSGVLAAQVCRFLAARGVLVECYAFDLSEDMLARQKANNPFMVLATSDFELIRNRGEYHCALLIDVIEHIPDNDSFADEVNYLSKYVLYNIPIERNLLDWLRNVYMCGQYYVLQTISLGHVHFFSVSSAKRFVRAHHWLLRSIFADFSGHMLDSPHPDHVRQRGGRLRRAELNFSRFVYRRINWLAPWLIQGSLFILAKSRTR